MKTMKALVWDGARAALTDRTGHPFAQPDPFTRSGVVDGVSALF